MAEALLPSPAFHRYFCSSVIYFSLLNVFIIVFISRFSPAFITSNDTTRFHGINERISVNNFAQVVQFYHQVIRNSDQVLIGILIAFSLEVLTFMISHGRLVVPSPKIVINPPRTYEKLSCKGEPY